MNGVKEKQQRNREKNNNTERNKQLKKTEVFFKFYAWLKKKSRSQKKTYFCYGERASHQIHTTTRERDDDDENV